MCKNLKYEGFVRGAFSINYDSLIDRGGDYAALAEADIFNASYNNIEYFNKAKTGVAYSIAIFNNEIFENNSITNLEYNLMQKLLADTINASNSDELLNVIDSYNHIKNKYIKFKWQK